MRRLLLKWLINATAFYLAASFMPSVWVDSPEALVVAAIVLGLVNLTIRPLLLLLTIPVNLLTLGLFTLVINTWMVMMAGYLTRGVTINGFWAAFWVALIISVLNMILVDKERRR